jgi:histidinol-phosphate/aromatic aminotransferase/cobyric acid decarboxylase-like protein
VVDLHHHGDREVGDGMLDLAVNVYAGPRPGWLDDALRASLDDVGRYPDATAAEQAIAAAHGLQPDRVLATAGAAEAFTLVARARPWQRPVVVHPQFTEPHAALEAAGHTVREVRLAAPFTLDPALVPEAADLVVLGNPTNPTGVLHPRAAVEALRRPGRLVVVDEAFLDCVPGQGEAATPGPGLLVLRSLTKHWGIPGIRAGYALGDPVTLRALRTHQPPWSVSAHALAAMAACTTAQAEQESRRRAEQIGRWREHLTRSLQQSGIEHLPSSASFVLARPGDGVHERLRERGVAVRRCDTFPGLGPEWVRIAVREETVTDALMRTLRDALR